MDADWDSRAFIQPRRRHGIWRAPRYKLSGRLVAAAVAVRLANCRVAPPVLFHQVVEKPDVAVKILAAYGALAHGRAHATLGYIENASTVASQGLSHLSSTTAMLGLTSKFGTGLGRTPAL